MNDDVAKSMNFSLETLPSEPESQKDSNGTSFFFNALHDTILKSLFANVGPRCIQNTFGRYSRNTRFNFLFDTNT